MASSTETTASSSVAGGNSTELPPHWDCLHLNLWTRFWPPLLRTCWPLLVSVGAAGDKDSQAHPLLLASTKQGPQPHNSGCLPPEGRRQTRQLLTGSRCTHLHAPLEYEQPPPSKAPPLAPVRAVVRQPGKAKVPEVGPHPEGLKADTRKTDPPPEDLGNTDMASRVTTLWTRCLTTWPQDGNETSRT